MIRILCAALATIALGACTSLLPHGSSGVPGPFESYAQAEAAAGAITAFNTRVAQLGAMGFDTEAGRNVTRVPYPDIIGRLVPHPGVPLQDLDPGIRQCIQAQQRCQAWLFHFERQDRRREGSFWLDFCNLRRVTNIKGWWIDVMVVAADGVVVFRNTAGQPNTDRIDRDTNPLGPFQPAGEGAGAVLLH